jgi:hypothetical protein
MSEIRPTQSRPDAQRLQNERPVKVQNHPHQEQMQRVEAKRQVVKQESANPKLKGGNVDITV